MGQFLKNFYLIFVFTILVFSYQNCSEYTGPLPYDKNSQSEEDKQSPGNEPQPPIEENPVVDSSLIIHSNNFSFYATGSQIRVRMPINNNQAVSMKFESTNNPNFFGMFSFASTTGNSAVQRMAWISKAPGGQPIDHNRCVALGTSSTKIRWEQNNTKNYCTLALNQTYYLNVKNQNCDKTNCDVFRNIYNNGTP